MYDDTEQVSEQEQPQQTLEPIEQESVPFHDQTIVAVRLADGRICVVLRWICESLDLQTGGQVRRIERTPAIAGELVRVKVQTRGGKQTMPALTLRGFPVWVLGINPNEVKDEQLRFLVIAYQIEAVDVLYTHFASKGHLALPEVRTVVPAETPAPAKPTAPEPDAPHELWIEYHAQMIRWHHWQVDMEQWRGSVDMWRGEVEEWRGGVESRLEGVQAMTGLIPEILERLGPQTLTSQHQHQVQVYARQLHQATGKPYPTMYDELRTVFEKPRYQDILEEEWPQVEQWFKVQIERASKKPR